jgi:serine/threonine protein kinase/formylglycine-generating enzyme required for sulfatase activity
MQPDDVRAAKTPPGTPLDPDPVEDLIATCLERLPAEGPGVVDSICAEHPSHADEIRAVIRNLSDVGLLAEEGSAPEATFPERLGEFHLIRRIGGGGMGVVYLAEQETLGRRVALKLIRPEHLYFPGTRERFRREVDSVARLQHPGIVPVYTVGEASGVPYFAMEWIDGCTLGDVLRDLGSQAPERLTGESLHQAIVACNPGDEPRDPAAHERFRGTWTEVCFGLVRDVALALQHAHERGVIHRDVKPSNVVVTRSGRVMLLDFGLARVRGVRKMTRTGSEMGSLPYMSPEQVRGEDAPLDGRADVYALGVTLYELLTLKVPYLSETSEVTRQRILEGRAEPIRARNRAVPRDAETVCLKAMERDPARRYATAADFARDLGNVLERRPIEARRPGPLLRARRWSQRHPALTALVVLGFLLVASSVGFAWRERSFSQAIQRLSDVHLVRYYTSEAEAFWPADPAKIPEMNAWLAKASDLAARRPIHEQSLAQLRSAALPYDDDARREDDREALERRDSFRTERSQLLAYLNTTKPYRAADQAELDIIDGMIRDEEKKIGQRHTWAFAAAADQWRHDMLTELVSEMDRFVALIATVSEQRRVATDLEQSTLVAARSAWQSAIDDIAVSDVYGHVRLKPQMGLVPLWKSPQSGLWEFLHVTSGDAPKRAPSEADPGRLEIGDETGVVLVLVPGGTFRMGSELPSAERAAGQPNVDPDSAASEQPVHSVTLRPFFVSKYELTRSQWQRLSARSGEINTRKYEGTHPADIAWEKADRVFRRTALALPTEAQWEYACRAGTTTVYFTGDSPASLQGYANIADRAAVRELGDALSRWACSSVDDGFAMDAPVGSFLPNPFGLYDVHGNIAELCADWFIHRGYKTMVPREGDGLLFMTRETRGRVCRGGSSQRAASEARSAARGGQAPGTSITDVGARPVRQMTE